MPLANFRKWFRGLSPRRQKVLRWGSVLLLIYTIFGFLILPQIVRSVATKRLAKELGREVTIKSVRINPYALSCSVRGLLIKDLDGEPFVSWDNFHANFELSSFFVEPWVFKEVSATNIYVRAQMNRDHTFNFSDLIEKFAKGGSSGGPSKPIALQIDELNISGTRAALVDLTPRNPFRRTIGPLQIILKNFHTDPRSRNPHSFTGSTDSGEVFFWSGRFSLNPIRAEGELSVENISLNKYAPLYQDLVRFEILDGVASFSGSYNLVSSPTNTMATITNATVALRSFRLMEPGTDGNLIELPYFEASGVSGDLARRHAEARLLSVNGAVLNLKRKHDASINVLEAAAPAPTATNAPGGIVFLLRAVTNAFSMFLSSTNTATAVLHDLSVQNCAVTLRDEINSRPAQLTLDQINVSAKNISNLRETNLTAKISLRWNTNGTIKTEIAASTAPFAADVHLLLERLELRPLDPYLEPFLNLFIVDSKLGLDGHIRLRADPGQLPEVTFEGGYRLDDFATVDGLMAEDLLKWKSLRFDGVKANLNPPTVAIDQISLVDAVARIAVETNQAINLVIALHPQNTNLPVAVTPKVTEPSAPSGKKAFAQLKTMMSRTNEASGPPTFSVGAIVITNAELQLTDRSVTPPVRASVGQLNGEIANISSDELRRAQVHLSGKIDNVGPVEITGDISPLFQNATSRVSVVVKDVDLNPADPYTGKFLGYRLRKGKVSMDITYEVTARQLKGANRIRFDQLTLGDKVDSPDATKLPVKLGIAVLKDRSGVIELDVPVEGNLDDPEFKLGRVIWHAMVNVFTKVVTSPFAVLGSLLGGNGEEVSYQEFNPGSAELLPPAKAKLDSLAKGLYERPSLEVEIEGNTDSIKDRDGLRQAKLEQQLQVQKWTSLRRSEQATISPQQVELTPEERSRYLAQLYQKYLSSAAAGKRTPGSGTKNVRAIATPEASEKGAQNLLRQLTPEEQQKMLSETERQLLESIPIEQTDLDQLASERAKHVQSYLVDSIKVEAERIYLSQKGTGTNGHRVYLHLQ